MASFLVFVLLGVAILRGGVDGQGEQVPRMVIQNRYSACQPRVECPPYEDDVLFRLEEEYSVTWEAEPESMQLNCHVECVADNAVPGKNVTFVGATRGTSTFMFEWRIMDDGGYLRRLDAQSNVLQTFTRLWPW